MEWISVNERQPNPDDDVLLYLTATHQDVSSVVVTGWFDCGYGFKTFERTLSFHKITHWMPLPEPPKV
jgi:hypothetical protein